MVTGRAISLSRNAYLGLFDLCEDVVITTSPVVHGSGQWLTIRRSAVTQWLWIDRDLMLVLVGGAFVFLFRNGKHFSVLRSVLVIQVCCFFMLDPVYIIIELFHSLHFCHAFLFSLFWWRSTSEVFLQYCPLIRQKPIVYRGVIAVPAVVLLLAALSRSQFLATVSLATASALPVLAIIFLVKAGSTQGKVTLIVHIVAGIGSMWIVFILNVFQILDSSLRDELVSQTLEITVIGAYALFQMIFQMGERSDEAEEHIAKPKKYEKIEEMLEALTHMDEEVRFEVAES
jgi:hypothetical protein